MLYITDGYFSVLAKCETLRQKYSALITNLSRLSYSIVNAYIEERFRACNISLETLLNH